MTEWEKERADADEKLYQRMKDMYTGVAGYMPNGWSFVEKDNPHGRDRIHMLCLADEAGREITFSLGWSGKDKKISVSGNYPHRLRDDQLGEPTQGGQLVTPRDVSEESPGINVSSEKPHKAIAADICRRFLPDYARIYDKCVERRNASDRYAELHANNWKAFRGSKLINNWRASSFTAYLNLEPGYGDIRMESAETVKLELRSLPVSVALSVLELLEELLHREKANIEVSSD